MDAVKVGVKNLIRSEDGSYILSLTEVEGERILLVSISESEAHAIDIEMKGVTTIRSLAHVVILNVARGVGHTFLHAMITEARGGLFYAKLVFSDQSVDAGPGDAIAVALHAKAPVYVQKSVMSDLSFIFENGNLVRSKKPEPTPQQQELTDLHSELEEELAKENYERAAELRDKIRTLEHE